MSLPLKRFPNFVTAPDTGLKPGVNERSHFQTFEAKLRTKIYETNGYQGVLRKIQKKIIATIQAQR